MDNTYSFLDQDGLFNMEVSAPAEGEQQPRGVAARPQRAAPVPLPPHQSSGGAGAMTADTGNGLLEALDSIARALAYTEKRVASAESRLLAALQQTGEEQFKKQRGGAAQSSSSWGGLFGAFGAAVAFFVIVALIFSWCRSRGVQSAQMTLPPPPYVYSGTVPYPMRAPTTPMLFSSGAASGIGPPPATFLS